MKIEKFIWNNYGEYYYSYIDSKTNYIICHGLVNGSSIGYNYHNQKKGFYLRNKRWS